MYSIGSTAYVYKSFDHSIRHSRLLYLVYKVNVLTVILKCYLVYVSCLNHDVTLNEIPITIKLLLFVNRRPSLSARCRFPRNGNIFALKIVTSRQSPLLSISLSFRVDIDDNNIESNLTSTIIYYIVNIEI